MKILPCLAVAVVAATACQAAEAPPPACKARADLSGRCFEVHGRLSLWNGAPSLRLWPVGTRRALGVIADRTGDPDRDFASLPADVQHLLTGDQTAVWGDYVVCPLTRPRPGRMQFVCIASARRLTARPR
jgi:hypothetical protein